MPHAATLRHLPTCVVWEPKPTSRSQAPHVYAQTILPPNDWKTTEHCITGITPAAREKSTSAASSAVPKPRKPQTFLAVILNQAFQKVYEALIETQKTP